MVELHSVARGLPPSLVRRKNPVRTGTTSLLAFQRNGYSVQCEHVRALTRLRIYSFELAMEVSNAVIARHCRSFELPPGSPRMAALHGAGPAQARALRDGALSRTIAQPLR